MSFLDLIRPKPKVKRARIRWTRVRARRRLIALVAWCRRYRPMSITRFAEHFGSIPKDDALLTEVNLECDRRMWKRLERAQ